jgi:hypothetical protein
MWQDPIVKEVREAREKYAAELGHDPNAIFKDIKAREKRSGRPLVKHPANTPIDVKRSA